jgi:hypothetical protein
VPDCRRQHAPQIRSRSGPVHRQAPLLILKKSIKKSLSILLGCANSLDGAANGELEQLVEHPSDRRSRMRH